MSGLMEVTTRRQERLFDEAELARLLFGGPPVAVRPVEPHAVGLALVVELGADDVPALAEVKDAVVKLRRPAPRRDADALGAAAHSTRGRVTKAPISARPPKTIASTSPRRRSGRLNP